MVEKVEFEAKSVDEAVEKACKALNLVKEQIKYDVLSYGATGIFGIVGAKKARIRVKRAPQDKKKKAKRKKPDPVKKPPVAPAAESDEAEPEKETLLPDQDPGGGAEASEAPEETEPPQTPEEIEPPQTPEEAEETENSETAAERLSLAELEEAATQGQKILERILGVICDDTRIGVELKADRVCFDVKGGNPAVLIGKRGQTLEAIQYLVEKMVNQQKQPRVRIVVDVEGYWENRRASLREMAKRMAEKSKQSGKPVSLGQMNAQDRRIIHLTLKDDPSVKTQSRGDGFFRKLIIFPRKASPQKSRQRNG